MGPQPKQTIKQHHTWLLILVTACLASLTALQARGSLVTRNLYVVSQSRSYSIFFLRVFSELAGLSLAATLSATLEKLKWALVAGNGHDGGGNRNKAHEFLSSSSSSSSFLDFLALDEGTSLWGLLKLVFAQSKKTTKLWSVVRLVALAVVPVSGILIMSLFARNSNAHGDSQK